MTTAAQLAQRRRTTAAAVRRRPPKPGAVPDAQRPTAIEQTYATMLARVLVQLDDVVREALPTLRADAADGSAGPPRPINPKATKGLLRQLEVVLERATVRRALIGDLDTIADRVSTFSREQLRRQVKASIGIDLVAAEPALAPQIKTFRDESLSLITSQAKAKVDRIREILTDAGTRTRVEDIAARIQEETGSTPARSALIARDQVLKLNNSVTAARHQAAGITEYTWRTSRDQRVRPGHRALEGKRFTYGDPPVVDTKSGRTAEPGQDYQCRCTGSPVLEGFEEALATGERETGTTSPLEWSPGARVKRRR